MNIGVTGARGYIGQAFVKAGYKILDCDVTNIASVQRTLARVQPDIVFHLAGKSDPDWCEFHVDQSVRINTRGTWNLMSVCAQNKIPAVLLSSSQIWGGGWRELFNRHSEASKFTPAANVYGMQKVAAETYALMFNNDGWQNMKVIRTAHIFDKHRILGKLNDLKHGVSVDAPTFIKRSFLHLDHFIEQVNYYFKWFYTMPPVLHLAGSKTVSYSRFWLEVCNQFGYDRKLIKSRRFEKDVIDGVRKAKRPHNGGLDVSLSAALNIPQFDYIDGIRRMKDES